MLQKFENGFTLIELLIVIAVIGVIATVVITAINPQGQFAKVRDAQRKEDLRLIQDALERYYVDNGIYPQAKNSTNTCDYGTNCYVFSSNGSDWIQDLTPYYLKKVPVDPKSNASCCPWSTSVENYVYSYGNLYANGTQYDLTARLENTSDPDRCEVKDYRFLLNGVSHWCKAFGGSFSNQLYERSPYSLQYMQY